MIYIYPYKMGSRSARELRRGLSSSLNYRVKLVRPDGRFNPRRRDIVINWGNSQRPIWEFNPERDLNHPDCISVAANKLDSFSLFKGYDVITPDWTKDQHEAQNWLDNGDTIVVRHLLNGHSGKGIEIVQEGEVPQAPLFVKYKKRASEWRVHVFKGEVIDTQQKKKRNEAERPDTFNTFIRNASTGWVYCRDGITADPNRDTLAIQAVRALGLDFGAVDMIYNRAENRYYILEVNTAPGLEGSTLEKYTGAILRCAA